MGRHESGHRQLQAPGGLDQIAMSVPYGVSTHVKTELTPDDGKTQQPFDFDRVFPISRSRDSAGTWP